MAKRTLPETPPKARTLEEAQLLIDELWEQLVEKDQQTRQNSKNSSRPPSSDSPAHTPSKDAIKRSKKSARSRGAQQGHKGHRRVLLPEQAAAAVHQHYCESHCDCGGTVQRHQAPDYRHQIFDLPEIQYRMEEHQLFHGHCEHCGQLHRAALPDTVSPTQMGAGLLSLCSILSGQYHLSIGKIKHLMKDVFGISFSTGAWSQAQWQVTPMLTRAHQSIHEAVCRGPVLHADETRHQRDTEQRWMWLATSQRFAYFMTHHSRGKEAAKRLLKNHDHGAVVISDQYAGYYWLPEDSHQLCWAHILRNLTAIAECSGTAGYVGKRLVLITLAVFRTRHRYEQEQLDRVHYHRRMHRLRRCFENELKQGELLSIHRYAGRCRQLLKDQALLWTFLNADNIPLTNNEAERRLRGYVLWRKGSYGVRSHRGELFRGRILSFVETCKLQGLSVFASLRQVISAVIQREPYPDIFNTEVAM